MAQNKGAIVRYRALDFASISPIAAFQQFPHTMNISASGEMKTIDAEKELKNENGVA